MLYTRKFSFRLWVIVELVVVRVCRKVEIIFPVLTGIFPVLGVLGWHQRLGFGGGENYFS